MEIRIPKVPMILDIGGELMTYSLLAGRSVNGLPGLDYYLEGVKSTANAGDYYHAGLYQAGVIYCVSCRLAQCAECILWWPLALGVFFLKKEVENPRTKFPLILRGMQ
jgi:hypothetical protein